MRSPAFTVDDIEVVDRLLTTTRTVRRRLDLTRPVPRAVVEECLALAMQAPTGSNRQGWRWVIVDDPERRRAMGEIYQRSTAVLAARDPDTGIPRAYREMPGTELTVPGPERADEGVRMGSSVLHLREHIGEVPVLVVPCQLGRRSAEPTDFGLSTFYGSAYPGVWNFMLALRSRGLGSALTTAHLALEEEMAALLGIPDDVSQIALLPVAYTIGDDFKPGPRVPLEDVVGWNGWVEGKA